MTKESPPHINLAVQPITILEQAFQRLRATIMVGDFLPGEKLPEIEVAKRMGISRPTLREVLRRLEAEWLVEIIPNRGAHVARLDAQDLTDIHEVWVMLMAAAVHRFASHAAPEEFAALEESFAAVEAVPDQGGILNYIEKTNRFFGVILRSCGNRVLADSIRTLVSRINFLRARSMALPTRQSDCTAELRQIVVAIREEGPEAARLAARRHIDAACAAARVVLAHPVTRIVENSAIVMDIEHYRPASHRRSN